MLVEITEKELPEIFQDSFLYWKSIFYEKVSEKSFVGMDFQGEDKNLGACNSLEEYLRWYCYHPSKPEPYRDYGFYPRELTFLLNVMNPNVAVELGTDKGLGTFMISRLCNPDYFWTVDNREKVPIPGDIWVETGYFAKMNTVSVEYILDNSWELDVCGKKVDFCFIDADHSEEAVYKDSWWAWENRNETKFLIAWHDYHVGHKDFEGLIRSVNKFSEEVDWPLYRLKDSSLAWMYRI